MKFYPYKIVCYTSELSKQEIVSLLKNKLANKAERYDKWGVSVIEKPYIGLANGKGFKLNVRQPGRRLVPFVVGRIEEEMGKTIIRAKYKLTFGVIGPMVFVGVFLLVIVGVSDPMIILFYAFYFIALLIHYSFFISECNKIHDTLLGWFNS